MNHLRIRHCTSQRHRRWLLHSRRAVCSSWEPSLSRRGLRRLWIASSLVTLPWWICTRTCRCCQFRYCLCQMTLDSYQIQPRGRDLSQLMAHRNWNHVRLLFLLQETCPGRGLSMHMALHWTQGSPADLRGPAGLPVPYDIAQKCRSCWRRSDLWTATPPSPVSWIRWGTRVSTIVDTSPGTLGTNHGPGGGSDSGPAAPVAALQHRPDNI